MIQKPTTNVCLITCTSEIQSLKTLGETSLIHRSTKVRRPDSQTDERTSRQTDEKAKRQTIFFKELSHFQGSNNVIQFKFYCIQNIHILLGYQERHRNDTTQEFLRDQRTILQHTYSNIM